MSATEKVKIDPSLIPCLVTGCQELTLKVVGRGLQCSLDPGNKEDIKEAALEPLNKEDIKEAALAASLDFVTCPTQGTS